MPRGTRLFVGLTTTNCYSQAHRHKDFTELIFNGFCTYEASDPFSQRHGLAQITVRGYDEKLFPTVASHPVIRTKGELHASGATLCVVTHSSEYARRARRCIRLFDGRIVEDVSVAA